MYVASSLENKAATSSKLTSAIINNGITSNVNTPSIYTSDASTSNVFALKNSNENKFNKEQPCVR